MNYIPIEGGDVLGKGAYGCIVTPAPECSGRPEDPDMVSKLLFDDDELAAEIEGYMRMAEIDPFHTFSMYTKAPFPCETTLRRVSPADRIKCQIMRPADAPMKALLFGKLDGTSFAKVLESNPDPKHFVVLIMRILLALSIMEGRVSHYDLHSQNIFVTPQSAPAASEPPAMAPHSPVPQAPPDSLELSHDSGTTGTVPLATAIRSEPVPSPSARIQTAEIWETSPTAPIARSGTAEFIPITSRVVPATDDALSAGVRLKARPVVSPFSEEDVKAAVNLLREIPKKQVLRSFGLDTLSSQLLSILRTRGFRNAEVNRRAVTIFMDGISDTYFRTAKSPPISEWRPIIIDYGMLRTIKEQVRIVPTKYHPYHFYYAPEFLLLYIWKDYQAAPFDELRRRFVQKLNPYERTYVVDFGKPTPAPWYIASGISDVFDPASDPKARQMFNMFSSSLEEGFLRVLFTYFKVTFFDDLKYSPYTSEARNDLWQMMVVKHDLFVFMMYIASQWNYANHALEPAIKDICDELAYLARMVVGYDMFKRPYAFQVYNALVPLFERAGFEMDSFVVASEPFEEFKYIKGTLTPEETVAYARSLPKIKFSNNRMISHNIRLVNEFVLGKRSEDPYTTEAHSDVLYTWFERRYGEPPSA